MNSARVSLPAPLDRSTSLVAAARPANHIRRVDAFHIQDLATALAGRYSIERELGAGGMATVYLARDVKHQRRVALKVLRPELASAVGPERFLREVTTTANLRHPHILPLFDSGEAAGVLYYVMPFVDGESLRDRLSREKQLPLADALQIMREVGDALDYAHGHGVVHRDIKPENILLENGHATVADFGIARAVTAAGAESLTSTGLGIGTPLYMSPEQATAEKSVDGRSDQYALATVLYEMLAGEPPFTGPTAHAILARRLAAEVPSLSAVRRAVPPHVEQAIGRAMSLAPADRFPSARTFMEALDAPSAPSADPTSRRRPRAWIAAAAALALVLATAVLIWSRRPTAAPLDQTLVAVFPFRVSGTDTTHGARLREGMVDFLDLKLSGAGSMRLVPPRTVVAAWRQAAGPDGDDLTQEEARSVARRLGAGAMVLGTIVGTPGRLILNASLLDAGGGVRARASVEGSPDSLHSLIDAFAAQLAVQAAGERAERLASLTSASLPALYAYLAGRAAYRAGRYDTASLRYGRALELDSTFALAALGLRAALGWTDGTLAEQAHALHLAWSHRERLGSRERVLVEAMAGPRHPENPYPGERIQAWVEAVRQLPDDPEAWIQLGDAYFHAGTMAGIDDPFGRAAESLRRAMALDTALNVEPMLHLMQVAALEGDTATVRDLVSRIPHDPSTVLNRLEAGVLLGDSAMIRAARRHTDSAAYLQQLLLDAQVFRVAIGEAERAAALFLERARPGPDQAQVVINLMTFYHQLGRPAAAAEALAWIGPPEHAPPPVMMILIPMAALGYLDEAAGAAAVARLERVAASPPPPTPPEREFQSRVICNRAWFGLLHGQTARARAAIERLGPDDAWGCRVLLEALLAAAESRPGANAAFGRLDSLLLSGVGRPEWLEPLARWRESQGDVSGAYHAVKRCGGYQHILNHSNCLAEQGRLAALLGNREVAIEAYTRYLLLRYDPEPSVRPAVERVRAELVRLVAETD
jgi:tRNA A-37 threonylcarbamoyl transferase component Bud32/tetratricopeptide (TPR) repeat protein